MYFFMCVCVCVYLRARAMSSIRVKRETRWDWLSKNGKNLKNNNKQKTLLRDLIFNNNIYNLFSFFLRERRERAKEDDDDNDGVLLMRWDARGLSFSISISLSLSLAHLFILFSTKQAA